MKCVVSIGAVGCTTLGQLEDDVRIAQQFKPHNDGNEIGLTEHEINAHLARGERP